MNKISFERGPQGERGPGLEASKINFDRVFAFVWKTRSKLILEASRPGPLSPWGPLSKEILLMANIL